jgi:hypothetical protein
VHHLVNRTLRLGGSVAGRAEEPEDQAPVNEATAAIDAFDAPRSRFPLRTVLISAGAVAVVLGVVLGVALTSSSTSPTSSTKVAAAAAASSASSAPLVSDSSTDGSDALAVGNDPGCAPAESAITTLLDNLISDVTDPTQSLADVQTAIDTVGQASAAAKSTAVKQALSRTASDLAALHTVTASGDPSKISSALGPISNDVTALYSACAA